MKQLLRTIKIVGLLLLGSISSIAAAQEKSNITPSKKYFDEYLLMQELQKIATFDELLEPIDTELRFEAKECGIVNAYYSPALKKITICYEYLKRGDDVIDYLYPRESVNARSLLKAGILMSVLFHELGHAIIHLKNVPVIGNQEDAADAIATIILLEFAKKSPQQGKAMIVGSLAHDWGNRVDGLTKIFAGKDLFADEHPLNEQRVFNRLCLAYGSNPALFIDSARQLKLPENRARRCRNEYESTKKAVDELIGSKLQ